MNVALPIILLKGFVTDLFTCRFWQNMSLFLWLVL